METENSFFIRRSLWTWGMLRRVRQDLGAHPFQSALLFTAVAGTVTLIGILLLLDRALSETYTHLMNQAPALVVRRIGSGGWQPMPMRDTLDKVATVPGVLHPRFRVWGVVRSEHAPVTVIGLLNAVPPDWPSTLPQPRQGEALVGPGLALMPPDPAALGRISLNGRDAVTLTIIGRLPRSAAMAAHDVVVAHATDARRLLGLSAEQASDLALDVFHSEEAEALIAELAEAFAWPVEIVTRKESLVFGLNDIARRTGSGLLAFLPALLALAWVVVAAGSRTIWQRGETGLLKALGWTGQDILRLHLVRSAWIGLPAVAIGAAAAYLLLFGPGLTWISRLVLGWNEPAPALYLSAKGALGALSLAALIVALPFFGAVCWSGWQSAKADPADMLEAQQG